MTITWIDDPEFECEGKTVFCRVDFNVPLDENLEIIDDSRILAVLPTIRLLLEKGAKLILASHLGRPKGKIKSTYSLEPVAVRLRNLLNNDVIFVEDCVGDGVKQLIRDLPANNILMLENTRFHSGEEKNERSFSKMIAKGIDIFVNDAFGAAHRAHSSTVGIVNFVSKCVGGLLMKREVEALDSVRVRPQKPFILILGGAKVSDKLELLTQLLNKADKIIIGGAMAYTFLKVLGQNIGASRVDEERLTAAKNILQKASENSVEIVLPIDHVVASEFSKETNIKIVSSDEFEPDEMGLDIGPKTISLFKDALGNAGTGFWNGPMGVFEWPNFSRGTFEMAKALAEFEGYSVVGGGDSLAAISQLGLKDRFSHVSTGGGASMEFLQGSKLVGLEALNFYG